MIRRALKSAFVWLNTIGSLILAFALVNPDARALFSGAINILPEPWQTIAGILVSVAWFAIVQAAQRRELKKAQGGGE